jgi:ATP-binding cassette subfamily B protein
MDHQLPNNLLDFIWHFLRPYKLVSFIFFLMAILAGLWGPFNSMLIKHVIDIIPEVKNGDITILILPITLIVLNFIIFDNITWRSISYINYKYLPLIQNQIVKETSNLVLNHSQLFFQDNLSGRLANQIFKLADNIPLILHRISSNFIRGASLLIISFVTAYYVNPMFFYILSLWFFAFASFSIYMSSRLVDLSDNHANTESIVSGQLTDLLTNHSNVRYFATKDYEISRMDKFLILSSNALQKKGLFITILSSIQGLLIATMMGFIGYFLVYLYERDLVNTGDFVLILGLSMELGHMMWFTMSCVDQFHEAWGKCNQSLKALLVPINIKDKENARDLIVKNGSIIFSNVKFHYKDADLLFQNKSIKIESGTKIGLVGYSGSGKSTFVNLILRLYEITEGSISIDGQDIRDVTQSSLRENISLIPQDPSLFQRSLIDNIRYGKVYAEDDEVIVAAKNSHTDEFISNLPEGYSSLVGERGVKLSGGERQRIAIARAMLKNAPILILDEATSQLDSVTETYIQESLKILMHGKTTIVIAHRLSTLASMDRILVFDQGKIIEDGTHTELLKKNGLYKTLWDTQVGGFLPDKKSKNI